MFKLKKALYGIKQAPRSWFKKCTIVITSLSFFYGDHDYVLFVRNTSHGRILLLLYFDDMITIAIFGNKDERS